MNVNEASLGQRFKEETLKMESAKDHEPGLWEREWELREREVPRQRQWWDPVTGRICIIGKGKFHICSWNQRAKGA